ncbi:ComEC/Rec2 family competence protein [Candidatus Dependentiae bacterium]
MFINKLSPLFLPQFSLLLGICCSTFFCLNNLILAITIIFAGILLFLFKDHTTVNGLQIVLCSTIFFSGIFLIQHQKQYHQSLLKNLQNKRLKSTAIVLNKEQRQNTDGEIFKLNLKKIKSIKYIPYNTPYKKKQFFYTTKKLPIKNININYYTQTKSSIEIGDKIKLTNFKIPNLQPKQTLIKKPNYLDYQIKENVLCSIFCKKLFYKNKYKPKFNVFRWINQKKNKLLLNIRQKLLPQTFYYFSYIFLGNKKAGKNNQLRRNFGQWGITHYLARSGLHVILFILIWKILLSLIPISLYLKQLVLISICMIYSLLSWSSISFYRAFYIFIFYELGKFYNQQTSFLHMLCLLCIIILLFNPIQLFFLDFQLSFYLAFTLGILGLVK